MSNLNNPRIVRAWTMYDWANSVYSLSISSAIFPAFFEGKTQRHLSLFGYSFINTALYTYALSAAFLIITLFIPLLSGISDYGGVRKPFMRFFIILGSIGCSALYWFNGDNYIFGLGCFMLASIGWAGSLVFYNSFLPEIVTPDRFDKTSAKGYTMGYIGSVLMLIINLVLIMKKEWFGFGPNDELSAIQIGFLLVGVWWLSWSFWPLFVLPKGISSGKKITGSIILKGYSEISKVFRKVLKMKPLLIYLAAFFIYTMGVQTIIYVAALFGKDELKLESQSMLITILLIQLVGIAGAYFFAWVADKKGNKFSLGTTLVIWVLVCVCAFMVQPRQPGQFFALACLVGTVMGGIQSLSRATFAKLIPGDEDNTSFFSFYEVTEKLAMVLGTFAFGLVNQITGNMRSSILMLMLFFIVGFLVLTLVKSPKLKPVKE